MKLHGIAFKWSMELPIGSITGALEQVGLHPDKTKNYWTRSIGDHLLQVEYRPGASTKELSLFWIRWFNPSGMTDKGTLNRVLSEWYFAMSQYATTSVYWMQADLVIDEFRPLYGYSETSPNIWTREYKRHRYSFYPVKDHYYFEVRNMDKKAILHHRFSHWLEDLKHNLLGQKRPDDQIAFDLVG
jgi:hypothetical protein